MHAPARPASRCPGYRACVMDDARQSAAAGQRRPARGQGTDRLPLPRRPAPGATTCSDGWNYTGDAYLVDDDGYFVYQARTDDMIISAGYNIAGPEVESALLLHPAVAECGVVGVARRGARTDRQGVRRAEGRARAGDAAMTAALQDFVKQTIAPYKYPRAIEYLATPAAHGNRQAAALPAADVRYSGAAALIGALRCGGRKHDAGDRSAAGARQQIEAAAVQARDAVDDRKAQARAGRTVARARAPRRRA